MRLILGLAALTALCACGDTADKQAPNDQAGASADEAVVSCPVQQPQARNGSAPDRALIERLIRCAKGEKSVPEGDEGAVRVSVSDIQIGDSRPWSYRQDQGSGSADTVVHPVRATYTVTTTYRTATEVEEDATRILNFYVNAFGEWQIGSEEPVRSPTVRRTPTG